MAVLPVLYLTSWPINFSPPFVAGALYAVALFVFRARRKNAARITRPLGWTLGVLAVVVPVVAFLLSALGLDVGWLLSLWPLVLALGVVQAELALAGWGAGHLFPAVDEFLDVRLLLVGKVRQALLGFAGVCAVAVGWFAGVYLFVYRWDGAAFAQVPPGANSWSFVYFAVLTAVTLGYTPIQPASPLAQTLVAAETVLFVALTVVIFGVLLMGLQKVRQEEQEPRPPAGDDLLSELRALREQVVRLQAALDEADRRRARRPWWVRMVLGIIRL